MSMIDSIRDVVEVVQKLDNIDLLRQLLKVQQEAMALFDENRALKEQLRERDERERVQADLAFRDNALWRGHDQSRAYCSRCWEAEHKLITLTTLEQTHHCPNCNKRWGRPSAPKTPSVRMVRGPRPRDDW